MKGPSSHLSSRGVTPHDSRMKKEQPAIATSDLLAALGGEPGNVARELAEFAESARALSGDHPRYIDRYPQSWVAVYRGEVEASGDSLESVTKQIEEKGLPAEHVIIRFVSRNQKTLFL